MEDKSKKIVLIYENRRNPSLQVNKIHFEDVEIRQRYYVNSEETIKYFSKNLTNTTYIEQKLAHRNLIILKRAELDGYLKVDWFELFKSREKDWFSLYVNDMTNEVAKHLPHIITEWNREQEPGANFEFRRSPLDCIAVLSKPINIFHTKNEAYFLKQNKIQKYYFNRGLENFFANIPGASDMKEEVRLNWAAHILMLRDACSEGIIVVDWELFFMLNQKNMKMTIEKAVSDINREYKDYFNSSSIYLAKREVKKLKTGNQHNLGL